MTIRVRRKQIVLSSLVLALGAAVYLNWQFSPEKVSPLRSTNSGAVERSEHVSGMSMVTQENEAPQVKFSMSYYEAARNNRKLAFDQSAETMRQILADPDVDKKAKAVITDEMSKLGKIMQQQVNIENIVKAKGYGDCVAAIQNGECTVTISLQTDSSVREKVDGAGSEIENKGKSVNSEERSGEGTKRVSDVVTNSQAELIKIRDIVNGQTGFEASKIKIILR